MAGSLPAAAGCVAHSDVLRTHKRQVDPSRDSQTRKQEPTAPTMTTRMRTSTWLRLLCCCWCSATMTAGASERAARGSLIAFNTIGHDVAMGLDLEMPFVRVPIGRHYDKGGQPRALMTVNTGAIVTTTLLAGGGLLVGYLLRSIGIQGTGMHPLYDTHAPATAHRSDADADVAPPDSHRAARQLADGGAERFASTLRALKLVYTNATGARVEFTLPQLYEQLELSFAERDVDLAACLWQSLCALVHEARAAMRAGRASAVQKIVDGVARLPWLRTALGQTAAGGAIRAAGAVERAAQCAARYASCNLDAPQEQLLQLLQTHVRFA